jgi:hypothetical protein
MAILSSRIMTVILQVDAVRALRGNPYILEAPARLGVYA